MSRSMKTANQTVFERLFEYCAARGTPCGPDAPRWVASTAAAKDLLKHLKLEAHLSLGPRRHLAWLRFRDTTDYLELSPGKWCKGLLLVGVAP